MAITCCFRTVPSFLPLIEGQPLAADNVVLTIIGENYFVCLPFPFQQRSTNSIRWIGSFVYRMPYSVTFEKRTGSMRGIAAISRQFYGVDHACPTEGQCDGVCLNLGDQPRDCWSVCVCLETTSSFMKAEHQLNICLPASPLGG